MNFLDLYIFEDVTFKWHKIIGRLSICPDSLHTFISVSNPDDDVPTSVHTLLVYLRSDQAPHHIHQLVVVLVCDGKRHETTQVVAERVVELEVKLVRKQIK